MVPPPQLRLAYDCPAANQGTTADMARFYWDLFIEGSVVPPETLHSMKRTIVLDEGWSQGGIAYGAGLMLQQVYSLQHGRACLGEDIVPFESQCMSC